MKKNILVVFMFFAVIDCIVAANAAIMVAPAVAAATATHHYSHSHIEKTDKGIVPKKPTIFKNQNDEYMASVVFVHKYEWNDGCYEEEFFDEMTRPATPKEIKNKHSFSAFAVITLLIVFVYLLIMILGLFAP